MTAMNESMGAEYSPRPNKAPVMTSVGYAGTGAPNCSINTLPKTNSNPYCSTSSKRKLIYLSAVRVYLDHFIEQWKHIRQMRDMLAGFKRSLADGDLSRHEFFLNTLVKK